MPFERASRLSPVRARVLLPLAALAGLVAGCQTGGQADANSTVTTPGDFQELAACYAKSQNAVVSRATGSEGARSVSVTTIEAAPAAVDALGQAGSKSADEAVEAAGAASYRVTFRELPDNSTRISGSSIGAATKPFSWFETALPALRICAGNPDLG